MNIDPQGQVTVIGPDSPASDVYMALAAQLDSWARRYSPPVSELTVVDTCMNDLGRRLEVISNEEYIRLTKNIIDRVLHFALHNPEEL